MLRAPADKAVSLPPEPLDTLTVLWDVQGEAHANGAVRSHPMLWLPSGVNGATGRGSGCSEGFELEVWHRVSLEFSWSDMTRTRPHSLVSRALSSPSCPVPIPITGRGSHLAWPRVPSLGVLRNEPPPQPSSTPRVPRDFLLHFRTAPTACNRRPCVCCSCGQSSDSSTARRRSSRTAAAACRSVPTRSSCASPSGASTRRGAPTLSGWSPSSCAASRASSYSRGWRTRTSRASLT